MPAYVPKRQLNFAGITLQSITQWRTPALIWGVAAGGAVSLFMSDVPLFKKDVLMKIPLVRSYFVDKTPDSDKPF